MFKKRNYKKNFNQIALSSGISWKKSFGNGLLARLLIWIIPSEVSLQISQATVLGILSAVLSMRSLKRSFRIPVGFFLEIVLSELHENLFWQFQWELILQLSVIFFAFLETHLAFYLKNWFGNSLEKLSAFFFGNQ